MTDGQDLDASYVLTVPVLLYLGANSNVNKDLHVLKMNKSTSVPQIYCCEVNDGKLTGSLILLKKSIQLLKDH